MVILSNDLKMKAFSGVEDVSVALHRVLLGGICSSSAREGGREGPGPRLCKSGHLGDLGQRPRSPETACQHTLPGGRRPGAQVLAVVWSSHQE